MQQLIRRSLELTPAQWQRLEELAAQFDANAPTGSNAGKPSWRTFVKELASDSFIITRKDTDR